MVVINDWEVNTSYVRGTSWILELKLAFWLECQFEIILDRQEYYANSKEELWSSEV